MKYRTIGKYVEIKKHRQKNKVHKIGIFVQLKILITEKVYILIENDIPRCNTSICIN